MDFDRAENDVGFRSMRMAERFRTIARESVPFNDKGWSIRLKQERNNKDFSMKLSNTRHELEMQVPNNINEWIDNAQVHGWLMSVCLLALRGELAYMDNQKVMKKLGRHWLVRGLAAKAAREQPISPYPFSKPFYQAYTLTANGIYPCAKALLSDVSPLPHNTALQRLNNEYAELFLYFMEGTGVLRANVCNDLLNYAILTPDVPSEEIFMKLTSKDLKADELDERLKAYLDKAVVGYFTPNSKSRIEAMFRKACELNYTDKQGKKSSCLLRTFPENKDKMASPETVIDNVMLQLKQLQLRAAGQFRDELSNLRLCVTRFRTDCSPEAQKAYIEAEEAFYAGMEQEIYADAALNRIERKHKTPGLRMRHTMDCIRHRGNYNSVPSAVDRILDHLDDYSH